MTDTYDEIMDLVELAEALAESHQLQAFELEEKASELRYEAEKKYPLHGPKYFDPVMLALMEDYGPQMLRQLIGGKQWEPTTP